MKSRLTVGIVMVLTLTSLASQVRAEGCLDDYRKSVENTKSKIWGEAAASAVLLGFTGATLFDVGSKNNPELRHDRTIGGQVILTSFGVVGIGIGIQAYVDYKNRDSYLRAIEMISQAYEAELPEKGQLKTMYQKVILDSKDTKLINTYSYRDFANLIQRLNGERAFCYHKKLLKMGQIKDLLVKTLRQ